jgi:hypothetical protein
MADMIKSLALEFAKFNTNRTVVYANQGTLGSNERGREDSIQDVYEKTSTGEPGVLESLESEELSELEFGDEDEEESLQVSPSQTN